MAIGFTKTIIGLCYDTRIFTCDGQCTWFTTTTRNCPAIIRILGGIGVGKIVNCAERCTIGDLNLTILDTNSCRDIV